jgi:hypothetical protein
VSLIVAKVYFVPRHKWLASNSGMQLTPSIGRKPVADAGFGEEYPGPGGIGFDFVT